LAPLRDAGAPGAGGTAAPFHPAIAERLLAWYDEHARDLPWRRTRDPYKILVSEIMLQQTQVKTVLPYYEAFVRRFPSVSALARAPVDEVLEVWKGLGYYRRARNLHAAAQAVVERFGGRVPDTWEEMIGLPGIGAYTAAAVLSIAYGKPYPVVDGNVIRVGARLLADEEPADSVRLKRRIFSGLSQVIPVERPGDFNQALMELGATVCSVRRPVCAACPIAAHCAARASGRAEELPVPARRATVREDRFTVIVARLGQATLLVRRPEDGLLAGLWEFPRAASVPEGEDEKDFVRAALHAAGAGAVDVRYVERAGAVVHRFSHLEWRMEVLRVELAAATRASGAAERAASDARWVSAAELEALALPRAMQKVWETAKAFDAPVRESGRGFRGTG